MALKSTTKAYENTTMAVFLRKQIDTLGAIGITQRDIALDAGYDKPNIFSMFKHGDTKVPLDKIATIAKALRVDPNFLFRLAIQQPNSPISPAEIELIFPRTVTASEFELIERLREATGNSNPSFPKHLIDQVVDLLERGTTRSGVMPVPQHL